MKVSPYYAAILVVIASSAYGLPIVHGSRTVDMEFVNIGYAGNGADTTGYGSVNYNYRMGKFEVTVEQWLATGPPLETFHGTEIPHPAPTADPLNFSSWYRGARFANWLTSGSYNTGAYQFNASGTLTHVMSRTEMLADGGLFYVLPTEDEWYKAAFFKSDGSGYSLYSTGDTIPGLDTDSNYAGGTYADPWLVGLGAEENNGTFDMNGNLWEWCESAWDGTLDDLSENRVRRGGSAGESADLMNAEYRHPTLPLYAGSSVLGFRVAAIPEPSTVVMLGAGGLFLFAWRRKRHR